MTKIAIVYYTVYGHTYKLAQAIQQGIEKAGGKADLYQIPELFPPKPEHPPRPNDPLITPQILASYDGILCGSPTYFGTIPAQCRAFWDSTTDLWAEGSLNEKYVGMFTSTGTLGGGHETTALTSLPNFVHHGMIFVPLGYKHVMQQVSDMQQIHGGSPWGAGTFTDNDGLREPSELELDIARIQGVRFFKIVSRAYP